MDDYIGKFLGLLSDQVVNLGLRGYSAMTNRNELPANQRIFLDTFVDKNKNVINEGRFLPTELEAIKKLVASKGISSGGITYEDYKPFIETKDGKYQTSANSLFAGNKNPFESIRTSLGQFRYQTDPNTGQITVSDAYDFNPARTGIQKKVMDAMQLNDYVGQPEILANPYAALRMYGQRNMPEGTGRPVRIKIPGLL